MTPAQYHRSEIERRLRDTEFPRRTAAAVLQRVYNRRVFAAPLWAAAAAIVFVAGVHWFVSEKNVAPLSGLSEGSARAVLQQAESAWQDTDQIINASFVIR
ncbi:MAG: hypothetical protein J0L53_15990 [Spirochaetes bacterium]|nr:hypothetical protein [Spirochaetota bacterium]MBX3720819.1 hypothetical protein [Turneriella sp.]